MNEYRSELFLRLQGEAAKSYKKYIDAMFAFNNSGLDFQLKQNMEQMNIEQQMAFDLFQSHFPKHSIW